MNLCFELLIGTVFVVILLQVSNAQENAIQFDGPIVVQQLSTPITSQSYTLDLNGGAVDVSVPVVLGGFTFEGGFAGGNLNLLNDRSVMKDLELVDEQISKLADIRAEFRQQFQKEWKELANARKENDKERVKELNNALKDLQNKQDDELSNVLLPHQLDRIKQVSRQMQMQMFGGMSGALQRGQIAKELEITDEQKKKLADVQKKMNEDIIAKTKEIRESAKKQAMELLTSEQKNKLKDLTGEEFKRDPKDWQEYRQKTYTRRKKK